MQLRIGVKRVAEPDLTGSKRAPVAAAILIMHRQQGQPDSGHRTGRRDPLGHLGDVGIGNAARLMVQIVEFHIGGISRLKHFHLHEGRDRLDMIGRQPVEKAEHQLPPGPE
jgi:hypothetical protein